MYILGFLLLWIIIFCLFDDLVGVGFYEDWGLFVVVGGVIVLCGCGIVSLVVLFLVKLLIVFCVKLIWF